MQINSITKRPKAVMFDLDDTIISYDGASEKAWKVICAKFTEENKTSFSAEEMLEAVDNVKDSYWSDPARHKWGREHLTEARREVLTLAMERLGFSDRGKIIETADSYTSLQKEMICLFDGAYDAVKRLKNAGIKTALITNGSSEGQREKLDRFALAPLFDEILIDTEVGFSKPDERIFRLALDRLSVPPEEAVMVGDNPVWDTEIPQKMGIFAVLNNFRGLDISEYISADMVVESIAELTDFLLSL